MLEDDEIERLPAEIRLTEILGDLSDSTLSIAQDIVEETDPEKVKDLAPLFNMQHVKKQVLRSLTYDQLVDRITSQMQERLERRADQFSNKELLDYLNVISTSLDKAHKDIQHVDEVPLITVNQQNNVLITDETLSRESRQRITDAVSAILARMQDVNSDASNQTREDVVEAEQTALNFDNDEEEI